jgi:hypothetical protein
VGQAYTRHFDVKPGIAVRAVFIVLVLGLAACSGERLEQARQRQQADLDLEVRTLVHDGMPVFEAVPALQHAGFACVPDGAAQPRFDCTRQRALGWTLASCVQRVNFTDTLENGAAIARLAVAPLACVGP